MYQLTNNPDILVRLSDGASVARGTWLWPQEWLDAGNVPEPIPVHVPTREEQIAAAWTIADSLCRSGADDNSRARYLAWLIDPATSADKRTKILAVQAWMDSVWMAYATYRSNPVGAFALPLTPCPFTFWQIASA